MNEQIIATIVFGVFSVCAALIGGAWVLSNKIGTVRTELVAQIASNGADSSRQMAALTAEVAKMKTDLAVMREREEQRAEKIEQMWRWWTKTLESGWIAHMKHIAGEQS